MGGYSTKHIPCFRVEDEGKHIVRWLPTLKKAKALAEEMIEGCDAVSVTECYVHINKTHLLELLNSGKWYGFENGIIILQKRTVSEAIWSKAPEDYDTTPQK
tara:strand:+ start:495 stop:800 length:306 start_codon:yes stop_codon:yes gene_type:complete